MPNLEDRGLTLQERWENGCRLAYRGNWTDAWPELECRMKGHVPSMHLRKLYVKPDWSEEDGKILVYQDQGFGDFFMWMRYLSFVPNLIVEADPPLVRLLRINEFNTIIKGDKLPDYDYVVPMASLPSKFNNIYSPSKYLKSPKSGKFPLGNKKKIGVAWAGNPLHADDKIRSSNANAFLRLAKDTELVSLMISQTDNRFTDLSLRLVDFADTAEVINECDAVVTVDTAVAHLAGALGKRVHLVLATEADWRWGSEEKSVWYPSMKIWRQKKAGDWDEVIDRISEEL